MLFFLIFIVNLFKIFECFDYYVSNYPDKVLLSCEEFDDIFSPILNDCEKYFLKL